jgi:hypothetical protein
MVTAAAKASSRRSCTRARPISPRRPNYYPATFREHDVRTCLRFSRSLVIQPGSLLSLSPISVGIHSRLEAGCALNGESLDTMVAAEESL